MDHSPQTLTMIHWPTFALLHGVDNADDDAPDNDADKDSLLHSSKNSDDAMPRRWETP